MDAATALTLVSVIAGATVTGIGSAMLWFRGSKGRIYERIEKVEETLKVSVDVRFDHAAQISLLKKSHETLEDKLKDIKDEIRRSATAGAVVVSDKIDILLNELRRTGHKEAR